MNFRFCFLLFLVFPCFPVPAQKYTIEKSRIVFFSDASIEDIKAENIKTSSLFNVSSGEVVFAIPIRDFQFDRALMQEHFNEKYLESDKFPKAIFQGNFLNFKLDEVGEQVVNASGKLTIHGVTREINFPGTIEVIPGKLVARSKFMIKLEDFKIKIPQLLWQNIAEEVEVKVEFIYKPL
jgi:polyisoprenoid-binding protein YceI